MKNIFFKIIAAFVTMLIVGSSCSRDAKKKETPKNGQQAQQRPPLVRVTIVKKEDVLYYSEYPATVVPLNQVDLRAQVQGIITSIFFKDGQHVKKGQKLYGIDREQYQAAFEQAMANKSVAEAGRSKAQQDADRYQDLDKRGAIAKQVLDHAMMDLEAAVRQVDAANALVKAAQNNLKFSVITAPFDGTIGISQVKLGSLIVPGQTLLNSISSDDPLGVDFAADEKDIVRFEKLRERQPESNETRTSSDSSFRIELPGNLPYPFNGRLYTIDRAVDPQTSTIKVRLLFPNRDSLLRAGMNCVVKILDGGPGQLLIPSKAVTEQLGEFSVYTEKNGRAEQHSITPGHQAGDRTVVLKGIKEGDTIITEGMQKLKNGAPVKIMNGKAAPAIAEKKNGP